MISTLKNALKRSPVYPFLAKYINAKKSGSERKEIAGRKKLYREFLRAGDLVFDVGANMGNRTRVFLEMKARVVAFEPQKICVDFLEATFKANPDFMLVKKALGANAGEAEMLISDAHTISTLSENWTKVTKESGRFHGNNWNEKQNVQLTTLDNAIKEFGLPAFIKIDVEGYEFEVLSGLSAPVDCISIEFASENLENTFKCIERINLIYNAAYQLTLGENMNLFLPGWVDKSEIKYALTEVVGRNKLAWGDVYIKKI